MESLRIEILNPKAKSLLIGLADLNLIRIEKVKSQVSFNQLLDKIRQEDESTPSLDEITNEVEQVRKSRHENNH